MKFPGVGDYHIPSSFTNVGTKMGVKIPLKVLNTPGPLDYSPKHPSTAFKNNNTSTTFGTSNRNLIKGPNNRELESSRKSRNKINTTPEPWSFAVLRNIGAAILGSLFGGRSKTPAEGKKKFEKLKELTNNNINS